MRLPRLDELSPSVLDAVALGALVGFVLAAWSARGSLIGTLLFVVFGLSVAGLRLAQVLAARRAGTGRQPARPHGRRAASPFDLAKDSSHKHQKYLM
jgi:hypothetical protein